ncbi:MAG: DEAD/DEAH box helicase [Eubacterium sp.]|nr:DEAD/DEAH box helicase [Eubacterium sp.]MCM1213150.1 DEAD/DEAH box helicase [Lachnospiraceae bacterium]MCM1304408.1 DEAD/DEAH box helicase [Butyrivibrio sp.]MCM1344158.1 DEAD/DEAH box helicase [Muribaculaceae bacterium]MCM1239455.1 DEAD/DEAH box helicase [Lachnospiraceae bacterium]
MEELLMEDLLEDLLDERIAHAVREMGFEKLSPIQKEAIPYLLEGDDVIGQAQTGTGKTAAFGIPILQKVDPEMRKLQAIILCPTRELAMQAAEELRKMAKYMHGIKILPVYGGQEIGKQIAGLKGVQIIVGTPGRVMDHMRRRTIKLDDISMVVLDEADEMLNMGFREDMETILGQIPNEHQTALFSATMPQPILDITKQFQNNARMIRVAAKELTIPLVSQRYYRIKGRDKDAACVRLLEYYQPRLCLIFCNTKRMVDELAEVLKKAGFQAEGLHGDMSQHQRDVAMNRFRNGSTSILIATDVAARGIDVDNVEVVINYDIPQDNEYYVHRIGRTGRAGKTGRSFTFVTNREFHRIREIERVCHTTIEEKKLPGAAKVLKAKADKYLNRAWELHEHEDMELMKSYVQRKMEEEGCDALEIAAVMLKLQVGDKGPEILADEPASRKGLRLGSRRDGKEDGGSRRDRRESGSRRDRRESDSRRDRREGGSGRDGRENGSRRDRREGGSWRDSRENDSRRDRREGGSWRDSWENDSRRDRRKNSGREDDRRRESGRWGDRAPRERDVRRDGSLRESSRREQEFGSRPPRRRRDRSGAED